MHKFEFCQNSLKPQLRSPQLLCMTPVYQSSELKIFLFDGDGYFRTYCVRRSVTGVSSIVITCEQLKQVIESMETIFKQWR
jgi:hypothetical protein